MSKFRKSRVASAMLCTLLFGGNASAVQKDMSKVISKNDLSTKGKELENRKPDDSGNPLLKYFLYFLEGAASVAKLADEGVGIAEANEYIKNEKLYPLGKLSIYKNLVARSYRAKTIETMRKLVDGSNKHKQDIQNFFDKVTKGVSEIKDNKDGCVKVKENLFDISLAAAGEKYLSIQEICRGVGLTEDKSLAIPEYVEEYVKAVLGVSVEDCDKILVSLVGDKQYHYIAFVKDNVCLKLSPLNDKLDFCLTGVNKNLIFDHDDFRLSLHEDGYGYSITLPYMEHILGVKHDEDYRTIKDNGDKGSYSFYGRVFRDLSEDWVGMYSKPLGFASKVFPDLFPKPVKVVQKIDV